MHTQLITIANTAKAMARAAYCIDDSDWGSERQIDAFNAFNIYVSEQLSPVANDGWHDFSFKASSDEIVNHGLELLTGELQSRLLTQLESFNARFDLSLNPSDAFDWKDWPGLNEGQREWLFHLACAWQIAHELSHELPR